MDLTQKLEVSYEDKLRHLIATQYFTHFNSSLQDINLDKAVQFGKVITFLKQEPRDLDHKIEPHTLDRIQDLYYSGIRKLFFKKNVSDLTFENQLDILRALPKVEGDAF